MTKLAGRRILVVEDHLLIAAALEETLIGFGCAVLGPANCVSDALRFISNDTIDAAILAVTPNDRDCEEVADALSIRNIPWMLATGYDIESVKARFGDVTSICKPYLASDVYQSLCTILRVERSVLPSTGTRTKPIRVEMQTPPAPSSWHL